MILQSFKLARRIAHYQALEIPPSATQRDIKLNFLKLAKIYHPDVYKGKNKQKFNQIQAAYEILKKP